MLSSVSSGGEEGEEESVGAKAALVCADVDGVSNDEVVEVAGGHDAVDDTVVLLSGGVKMKAEESEPSVGDEDDARVRAAMASLSIDIGDSVDGKPSVSVEEEVSALPAADSVPVACDASADFLLSRTTYTVACPIPQSVLESQAVLERMCLTARTSRMASAAPTTQHRIVVALTACARFVWVACCSPGSLLADIGRRGFRRGELEGAAEGRTRSGVRADAQPVADGAAETALPFADLGDTTGA